jgi:hypothetical protein
MLGVLRTSGRLGYALFDPWLIYVSGGYAETEVRTAGRFGGVGVPPCAKRIPSFR